MGSAAGGPVYDAQGRFLKVAGKTVLSRLNAGFLAQLARLSGGRYVTQADDDSDWRQLQQGIARLIPYSRGDGARQSRPTALYPPLLALSLLLFLGQGMSFPRRRRALLPTLSLLACLTLPFSAPQAGPWQEARAYAALREGDFHTARRLYAEVDGFRGALGQGVAAYRQAAWQAALDSFQKALRLASSDEERRLATYNIGTTWLRLGALEAARQALEQVLRWQPGHKGATLNLALVEEAQRRARSRAPQRLSRPGEKGTPREGGEDLRADVGGHPTTPLAASATKRRSGGNEGMLWRDTLVEEADARLVVRQRMAAQEAAFEALAEDKPW